jgi:molecular chaperone GrpE
MRLPWVNHQYIKEKISDSTMNKIEMITDQLSILKLSDEQRNQLQQELGILLKERMSLKQALQQQSEKATSEKEELFLELLEVFDALEFFLNYVAENPDPNPKFFKRLPKSLGSIQKKLLNILERRQVQPIDFQETKPDYSVCQVVDREERDDLEEQTITKVVRQGFRVENKILRPIEVITSKKP